MSLMTVVICDIKTCRSRAELGDDPVPGAEEILEVRDAEGKRYHFCGIEHLRQWAAGYRCPYPRIKPAPTKQPVAWPKTAGPKQ
jgi:hypothetical protein